MEGKILVAAPRGAGSNFLAHLISNHYKLDDNFWLDTSCNEYFPYFRLDKFSPHHSNDRYVWDDNKWNNISCDVNDLNVQPTHLTNRLEKDANGHSITGAGTLDSFDYSSYKELFLLHLHPNHSIFRYVTSLMILKGFARAVPKWNEISKFNQDIDLKRFRDYVKWLNDYGLSINHAPNIHYFFNSFQWNIQDLYKLAQGMFNNRMKFYSDLYSEEYPKITENVPLHYSIAHKGHVFTYDQLIEGTTNTFLDSYNNKVKDYHSKNIGFLYHFSNKYHLTGIPIYNDK